MSSQANTNPQTEPTMEEILASIRKIISEDQPAEGAKPAAARPAPAKPAPIVGARAARAAAAPAAAADLDVLDLTDEIPDEEPPPVRVAPRVAPPPSPAAAIENDVIFQNIEPAARIKERTMDDDFISDSTRSAMGRAFQNLNGQGARGHAQGRQHRGDLLRSRPAGLPSCAQGVGRRSLERHHGPAPAAHPRVDGRASAAADRSRGDQGNLPRGDAEALSPGSATSSGVGARPRRASS